MDKIILKGMKFYGYHGAMKEENKIGQRFIVDVILYLPLHSAGIHDDLDKTVHYGEVYEIIKKIMEGPAVKLLETLGEKICSILFSHFSLIESIEVCIKKPEVPIAGILDYAAIEIRRDKHVHSLS